VLRLLHLLHLPPRRLAVEGFQNQFHNLVSELGWIPKELLEEAFLFLWDDHQAFQNWNPALEKVSDREWELLSLMLSLLLLERDQSRLH
jgi:hypothetical protein